MNAHSSLAKITRTESTMRRIVHRLLFATALAVFGVMSPPAKADEWLRVEDGGFGMPENFTILAIDEFDGFLYAGTRTSGTSSALPEIWKTPLGEKAWREVTPPWRDGMGQRAVEAMAVFRNHLYVGTGKSSHGLEAEVWRTRGGFDLRLHFPPSDTIAPDRLDSLFPDGDAIRYEMWTEVTPSIETDTGSFHSVTSMAVFGDYLYMAVSAPPSEEGGGWLHVWRTFDGRSWSLVVDDGFAGADNWAGSFQHNYGGSLVVFQGQLYVAASAKMAGSRRPGCQIWRSPDARDWSAVVGSNSKGALLSGAILSNGFGSPSAAVCKAMAVFNGSLYVGTVDHSVGRKLWRFDGSTWQDVTSPNFTTVSEKLELPPMGIQSLAVYGHRLFAGDRLDREGNATVWASTTGDATDWFNVGPVGGASDIVYGFEQMLATSGGYFYVATTGDTDRIQGGQVYRKIPIFVDLVAELGWSPPDPTWGLDVEPVPIMEFEPIVPPEPFPKPFFGK